MSRTSKIWAISPSQISSRSENMVRRNFCYKFSSVDVINLGTEVLNSTKCILNPCQVSIRLEKFVPADIIDITCTHALER